MQSNTSIFQMHICNLHTSLSEHRLEHTAQVVQSSVLCETRPLDATRVLDLWSKKKNTGVLTATIGKVCFASNTFPEIGENTFTRPGLLFIWRVQCTHMMDT